MKIPSLKVVGAVLAAVVFAIIVWAQVRQHGETPPPTSTSTTTVTPTVTETETPSGSDVGAVPKDEKPILDVARKFATEWAQPGDDWVKRLRKYTTTGLGKKISTIDQELVPKATVTDVAMERAGDPVSYVVVTYSTGLKVRMAMIYQPEDTAWKVMSYDRA